jgi:hypothetical protein
MKKVIIRGLTILFLFSLLPAGFAHAGNYYVSTSGSDSNSGDSIASPFATIQHAIDTAAAGDTIFVAAGTYNENIAMKSGISVTGNSPADTIIQAPIAIVEGIVNFHDVDCAILRNFTITIPPIQKQVGVDRGVVFDGSTGHNAVLENCIIYGVQYGMYIWWPATPSIVNNVLDGKGTGEQGIYVGNDATSPHIINNIITGWDLIGIHVVDELPPNSNDPNLEYNDVWGNTDNYVFSDGTTDTPFTPVPDPINFRNRGNISDDPLFVNPATNDYHLSTGSPCLASGFPNGEFQNPYILTPGDGGFDMGAYGGGGNTLIQIVKGGLGSGAVTSLGGTWLPSYPITGIPNYQLSCPSSCSGFIPYPDPCSSCASYYTAGSSIELTAAADEGSYFEGWSGCVPPGSVAKTTQNFFLYFTPVFATFDLCTITLSGDTSFGSSGGTGVINIDAPDSSCAWTVSGNDWITITSDTSGSGSGTVSYTVAGNDSDVARIGTITIDGQTFTVSQDPCTYDINPYKTYIAAAGGQYTASVFASSGTCPWTAVSNDSWITIDSGDSGTGNGTVTYTVSNTEAARTGTMTIAGKTFVVNQIDNSLQETIVAPSAPTAPGEPLWITATFVNNTGQTLITGKPTCCDTYFWVTNELGNMVPPRDRICEPFGIPDSLVSLPPGPFTITCDLSEMVTLTAGTYDVMATFVNPLPWDPDYDASTGLCRTGADREECYNLRSVVAPSVKIPITIGGVAVQKELAVIGLNPLAWDPHWAMADGPAISAQISIFDGGGFSDSYNLWDSIRLNGQVPIIANSGVVQNGVLTVKFDRSQAVQSLGSLFPGTTAVVTIQGSLGGTDVFYGQASVDIVEDTGTLMVQADLHTVGKGSQPDVGKAPIAGMETRVFDKKKGSCAEGYGISWQNYPAIWANCTDVAAINTDVYGQAIFALPQGDYLVIGLYNSIYPGVSVGAIDAGSIVNKYLQAILTANGNILPATYQRFTGSELLLIEPEYVEWSESQELYPFVFESSGDWSVTTSVAPPEGFVADQESLSTEVNSTSTALQFTVADIGSKWVSTKAKHKIKHKGKTLNVESKIGLKLAPGLQKKLGLGEFGEKE